MSSNPQKTSYALKQATSANVAATYQDTVEISDAGGDYNVFQFHSTVPATVQLFAKVHVGAPWTIVDTIVLTADGSSIESYFEAPYWAYRVEAMTGSGTVSGWARYGG